MSDIEERLDIKDSAGEEKAMSVEWIMTYDKVHIPWRRWGSWEPKTASFDWQAWCGEYLPMTAVDIFETGDPSVATCEKCKAEFTKFWHERADSRFEGLPNEE